MVLIPHTADFALQKIYKVSYNQIWAEAGNIASKLWGKELNLKKGDCALLYVSRPLKVDMPAKSSHVTLCPLTFPLDQVLRKRFALLLCTHGMYPQINIFSLY